MDSGGVILVCVIETWREDLAFKSVGFYPLPINKLWARPGSATLVIRSGNDNKVAANAHAPYYEFDRTVSDAKTAATTNIVGYSYQSEGDLYYAILSPRFSLAPEGNLRVTVEGPRISSFGSASAIATAYATVADYGPVVSRAIAVSTSDNHPFPKTISLVPIKIPMEFSRGSNQITISINGLACHISEGPDDHNPKEAVVSLKTVSQQLGLTPFKAGDPKYRTFAVAELEVRPDSPPEDEIFTFTEDCRP